MIAWSNRVIRITFGIGGLALIGMLADTYEDMPFWLVLIIAMLPLAIFVFIKPGELSDTIVKYSHLAGALWFLIAAGIVGYEFSQNDSSANLLIYSFLLLAGIVPSAYVLYKILINAYEPG